MHNFRGGQDSRFFGGDSFSFSCFLCFFVRRACLIGFPFYIGFYSKDLILLGRSLGIGGIFYFTFLGGCLLTIYYSFRLLKGSFIGLIKTSRHLSYSDNKIFILSVLILFLKRWLLGRLFISLIFFDRSLIFLGFDLTIGLILISVTFLVWKKFISIYKSYLFIYLIGYQRWFKSSGSSRNLKLNKMFQWDRRWLEITGGQGVFYFLNKASKLDFFKSLSLGAILFLTLIIYLISLSS